MDSLSSLMGTAGSAGSAGSGFLGDLSKIAPLLQVGTGIAGTIGNVEANSARNKVLSSEMQQMNFLNNLTPSQLAANIQQLQQPLSQGLTQSVGNTVQGQLAERGLSQSPGIYADVLAQAIAPYQQQEQQMATNAYFQKLGLPISARPSPFGPYPQTSNTSSIWQSLFNKGYNPTQQNQQNTMGYFAGAQPYGPTDSQLGINYFSGSGSPSSLDPNAFSFLTADPSTAAAGFSNPLSNFDLSSIFPGAGGGS